MYLDTIYHYDNTRIEPRLTYLENDYLKSTYTYNILNKIESKTIRYWDQHLWEPFSFSKTIDYSYLVSSTIETNIIDEITVHYYRDGGCLGLIYKINNDYTGLTGKLENYSILLKTDDNTFINKTAYSYNYYSTEELQKEKIKRFNNNDDVIFYKEINYLYDYSGNITSKNIKIGVNEYSITSNVTDIYQYSFDRLIRIDTNNSFKTFTYDDYGNIIEVDFYNNNQLIKKELFSYVLKTKISEYIVKDSNNIILKHYKYYYDGFENRYKKEDLINNTIINYHYLDNKLLCQSNDLIYLYDGDELIGFNYNNRPYSYLKDDVGNIISIVIENIDGESIEVARYEYDGYGNVTVYSYDSNDSLVVNSNDSFIGNINPYRYKGYYYDVET